jgi:hypothetical protein
MVFGTLMTNGSTPTATNVAKALVLALFVAFVAAGVRGVDFGQSHWDEPTSLMETSYLLQSGRPLPRNYVHPTGLYIVMAVSALPEAQAGTGIPFDFVPYLLRTRTILILLSSTTLLAAALMAWRRRGSWWDAALAAGIVAGSFELSSHSRFATPDGLLTALVAWSLCATVWSTSRPKLLFVAAALAGLAAGTKYTGVIVLGPVLVLAIALPHRLKRVVALMGVAFVAFVVTTPGILVEPGQVIGAFRYQSAIYANGFYGYAVSGPVEQAAAMGRFLATALSSSLPWASILWALCAAVGGIMALRVLRTPSRLADSANLADLGPAVVVVAWLTIFLAQRTFIARNFIPLVSPIAVLAAGGFGATLERVKRPWLSLVAAGLAGIACVASLIDLHQAASTIEDRKTDRALRELAAFVDEHHDERFLTSPYVIRSLRDFDGVERPNLVPPPFAAADRLIAFPEDLLSAPRWGGTDPFLAEYVFGPREINWNLYPTWPDPPRVVVMSLDKARRIGAHLSLDAPVEKGNQPPLPAWLDKPPFGARTKNSEEKR